MTLARVRAEIEPCADHEYAAFRLRWMHVGGADLPADQTRRRGGARSAFGNRGDARDLGARDSAGASRGLSARDARPRLHERADEVGRGRGRNGRRRAACERPVASHIRPAQGQFSFAARPRLRPRTRRSKRSWRALGAAGAQYLDEVAERANVSERDALSALWRMAARAASATTTSRRCGCSPTIATPSARSSRVARRPATSSRCRHSRAAQVEPLGPLVADTRGRNCPQSAPTTTARARAQVASIATEFSRARCSALESTHISWSEISVRAAPARIWRHDSPRMVRAFALGRAVCAARGGRDAACGAQSDSGAREAGRAERDRSRESVRRHASRMRYRARGRQRRRHSRGPRDLRACRDAR